MTKIFFNGGLVYEKDSLPNEAKAMSIITMSRRENIRPNNRLYDMGMPVIHGGMAGINERIRHNQKENDMQKMTQEQKYKFVRFIIPHLALMEFSGIKCAETVRELWGIDIDYHIYSDVLDMMRTYGIMGTLGHNADGMTIYYKKES